MPALVRSACAGFFIPIVLREDVRVFSEVQVAYMEVLRELEILRVGARVLGLGVHGVEGLWGHRSTPLSRW